MNELIATHENTLKNFQSKFERTMDIDWNDRLIGLTGARGVGKTSFLINHIIKNLSKKEKALYISMDDIHLSTMKLVECAESWVKQGGTH